MIYLCLFEALSKRLFLVGFLACLGLTYLQWRFCSCLYEVKIIYNSMIKNFYFCIIMLLTNFPKHYLFPVWKFLCCSFKSRKKLLTFSKVFIKEKHYCFTDRVSDCIVEYFWVNIEYTLSYLFLLNRLMFKIRCKITVVPWLIEDWNVFNFKVLELILELFRIYFLIWEIICPDLRMFTDLNI